MWAWNVCDVMLWWKIINGKKWANRLKMSSRHSRLWPAKGKTTNSYSWIHLLCVCVFFFWSLKIYEKCEKDEAPNRLKCDENDPNPGERDTHIAVECYVLRLCSSLQWNIKTLKSNYGSVQLKQILWHSSFVFLFNIYVQNTLTHSISFKLMD